jgi:uncharacterized repeat protein (TIGR03803 family)
MKTTTSFDLRLLRFQAGMILLLISRLTCPAQSAAHFEIVGSGLYESQSLGLIEGQDGMLYGATEVGGAYTNQDHPSGWGKVFRRNKDGTDYSIIHDFGSVDADGCGPVGTLLQGSDGALYGTTWQGGSNGTGTIFNLATNGSTYSILKHFDYGCEHGFPVQGVIEGSDGILYGTTGDWYCYVGTVFTINKDGTSFRVLLSTDGFPGPIVEGTDSALYTTTYHGGGANVGHGAVG